MFNPVSIAISTAVKAATTVAKETTKKSNSSSSKSYKDLDKEFTEKYNKEIKGIANYNNVDMGVAKDMFKTNLATERGTYGGGGKAENWGEMLTDYKNLMSNLWTTTSTSTSKSGGGGTIQSTNNHVGGVGVPALGVNEDTMGVIVGIGVLYMFLSIFRR